MHVGGRRRRDAPAATAYLGSAGYRRAQRLLEEIPAALLATLPAEVQAVLLAK